MSGEAGRPSRKAELEAVARLASTSTESVRAFFFRPGRLSPALRQRIADAVAQTGYQPATSTRRALEGYRVGYELPRCQEGSTPSPVMIEQLQRIVLAVQREGGVIVPFVVDPPVPTHADFVGGTELERAEPALGLGGWVRSYAASLSPEIYRDMLRHHGVNAFVVNDPHIDDIRVSALVDEGVPFLSWARALEREPSGTLRIRDDVSFVANDYTVGFRALINQARQAGCGSICHVGFEFDGTAIPIIRREAVIAAAGNVPHLTVHYEQSRNPAQVERIADFAASVGADALICDSDELAFLATHAAQTLAERDPIAYNKPLLVTGVDNSPTRQAQPAHVRWPTLEIDQRTYIDVTIAVLVDQRNGQLAARQQYVAPLLVLD